jgi:hypothetical protein
VSSAYTPTMPNFYNGIELLREVDSTWHHVNGTVPWSEHDEAGRLVAALAWKYNSCAVDAVFVAALLLNVGRVQAGQADQTYLQ